MKFLQKLKRLSRRFQKKSGIDLKIRFIDDGLRVEYDLSVFGMTYLKRKEAANFYSQMLHQLPQNVQSLLQEYDLNTGEIRKNEAKFDPRKS